MPLERELSPPAPLFTGGGSVLSIWKDGVASFYGPICGGEDGPLRRNLPKVLFQAADGGIDEDLMFGRIYRGVLVGEANGGAWWLQLSRAVTSVKGIKSLLSKKGMCVTRRQGQNLDCKKRWVESN
ncbi:hypothetical protein RchiOBHm_Chr1g0314121 [Rosa chinensis]|uniref:Uncharacterized protein n=1 Tax=Rosa chinensis TaxID=74649 RepID=A0A2P6S714_ROSCH|nr:hypothetical protein RchiOBHm_Chr1g0314121 [Rosa chinensis]